MNKRTAGSRVSASDAAPAHWMIRSNLVNRVLDVIGDAWIMQILSVLMSGPHRFDQIVALINVPRSTLAARLRQLVEAGCVIKQEAGAKGRKGAPGYRLTAKGGDLAPTLKLIRQWNDHWRVSGRVLSGAMPPNPCGHAANVEVICACCGRQSDARDMKVFQSSLHPVEPRLPPNKRVRTSEVFAESDAAIPAEGVLGDRWAGLIVAAAFFGATKYSDIEGALRIAPNILAARLERLTKQGLLSRTLYQSSPPRHAYHLTEKGLSLYPIIVAMDAWARKWMKPREDLGWRILHKPCLEWFAPRIQCARCKADVF
ncbi:MAG: helix-turn-helix transcriptional regulator [Hyphomonadaceae bacterium]|nr:helix-turn-helix transcriptional regulator [Hyphomonadaceae bacterium]